MHGRDPHPEGQTLCTFDYEKDAYHMKKIINVAAAAAALLGTLAIAAPAQAGEGHWSIGKGVQCRVILGVVVCSGNRP